MSLKTELSIFSEVTGKQGYYLLLKMINIIGKIYFSEMTQVVGKIDYLSFKLKYNF